MFCHLDQVLFSQGDDPVGLFILQSGEAAHVMRTELGEVAMCISVPAASLLGLPASIGNAPYTLTATARRGSEVQFISQQDFMDLIGADPPLSLLVLKVFAAEVRSARATLAQA
jgi:CRP-like cAMP-binding protein